MRAVAQHDDAVGQQHRLGHVVGDHHRGQAQPLVQGAVVGARARRGSAGRARRTARPSASAWARRRARGPRRPAGAGRRRARRAARPATSSGRSTRPSRLATRAAIALGVPAQQLRRDGDVLGHASGAGRGRSPGRRSRSGGAAGAARRPPRPRPAPAPSPASGSTSRLMVLSSVVLPEPEPPTRAMNSPAATLRLTPRQGGVGAVALFNPRKLDCGPGHGQGLAWERAAIRRRSNLTIGGGENTPRRPRPRPPGVWARPAAVSGQSGSRRLAPPETSVVR